MVETAQIPQEMKDFLLEQLPEVMDEIEESTKAIYDPNAIWLEAMQFADYVQQHAKHLEEKHGDECVAEVAEQLHMMCTSFKNMGENALKVLDQTEGV